MNSIADAKFRLKIAEGFLAEARQDFELGRWRSCVDGAQLAAENALKAIVALWSPVPRTHEPGRVLLEMIEARQIQEEYCEEITALVNAAAPLGHHVHIQTDYGDETAGLTPWDLFEEDDARRAQQTAESVLAAARKFIEHRERSL